MAEKSDELSVERARDLLTAGDPKGALRHARRLLDATGLPPGLPLVRAQAFLQLGHNMEALQALQAELFVDPHSALARQQLAAMEASIKRETSHPPQRNWNTALTQDQFQQMEFAATRYTYRGIPMVKNPFDVALYLRLLHQVRPATIIEVGTYYGGSAIWFADITRASGIATHIYSIDIALWNLAEDERVTFIKGNGRELEKTLSADFLRDLPRPLLVIEDADHEAVTSLAVLNFFHPILRSGEYIVVEDGMSCAGPTDALKEFFGGHGSEYEVDTNYCDYYGYNMTWCLNGWLRKR